MEKKDNSSCDWNDADNVGYENHAGQREISNS